MAGKIMLTGDRPTGKLHIGHYVGSLRQRLEIQKDPEFDKMFIMIADAQALTDNAENPQKVREDYDPVVEDELLRSLGEFGEDDLVVLVLATIPKEVEKTSVNLKAPLIINAGTRKGVQLVADNQDYEIKHFIMKTDKEV